MTVGLAVVVMAVLERERAAGELAKLTGAEIVYDPGGKGRSALRCHRAAIKHADDSWIGATHICVLQDDAIPCPGFVDVCLSAIEARPNAVLSLYLGSSHGGAPAYVRRLSQCQRFATLPLNLFVPTVGIVWPVSYARSFVAYTADSELPYDDEAVMGWRRFLRKRDAGVDVLATIPSIVQHSNKLPSIIGHHSHGHREAVCDWQSWKGPSDWREGWQ